MPNFLEFFAGGGMARAGLGNDWACQWANDFDPTKARIYRENWGGNELVEGDVAAVDPTTVPPADLAWASFPCQDLSLAGDKEGIGHSNAKKRTRSGTFWPFMRLMRTVRPTLIVLENVEGALTSNDGQDIRAICSALSGADYRFGPLVIDAALFVPQSRPRLFVIAVRQGATIPEHLCQFGPESLWHDNAVIRAFGSISDEARGKWIWWTLPAPVRRVRRLGTLIEKNPRGWVSWHSKQETDYLLSLMNELHRSKVRQAQELHRRIVGTVYRRTRNGKQRAEVRFDGVAGCLRTSAGGSSRQIVLEVNGSQVRSRLLSPREAARLQGLPASYWLPPEYNDAYDVVGDGLCVPVVAHLRRYLLDPLAAANAEMAQAIA